jgi:hypothetical protein
MFPVLQYGALSGPGEGTVEQVARVVTSARTGDEPVGTHEVFVRNLVYYTRLPTFDLTTDEQLAVFLRQDARVIVVADADALARVEQEHGLALERVAAFRYFDEAGIRLRTLLQPDAARDISRVVVAVNR